MTTERVTERPATAGVLAREVGEFLIELAIALHKHGVYPPEHPVLSRVSGRLLHRLESLLQERPTVSLGVARTQLVIEGIATDASHPVLRRLALQFHDHHLAALRFRRGVEDWELNEMLRTLAGDRAGGPIEPVGLRDELPAWPSIHLAALGFGDLEIVEPGEDEGLAASRLWVDLARAALAGELAEDGDGEAPSPSVVAKAIDRRSGQETYDQVIAGYLLEATRAVGSGEMVEAAPLTARVGRLVRELAPETLRRLMSHGGDRSQQQAFMRAAASGLPVDSVVRMLAATAEASNRPVSESLLRMYEKMAMHAEAGPPVTAGRAQSELRAQIQALVDDWELDDPAPEGYGLALAFIARTQQIAGGADDIAPLEPDRLLQMCFEMDAAGPVLESAVERLVEDGRGGVVLDMLDDVAASGTAAGAVLALLTQVDGLPTLLTGAGVESTRLVPLVERMGELGIDTLLDILLEAEERAVRRRVFDLLVALGPRAAPAVDARFPSETRWYAIRNLLALHDELGTWPDTDVVALAAHEDGRVRREALKLLLKDPERRAATLARILEDDEPRVVQLVRGAEDVTLSRSALPVVLDLLGDEEHEALHPSLIRLLARITDPQARDALVGQAVRGKNLLGQPRFDPATPASLAALEALASHWSHDASAVDILNRALETDDPAVQTAARAPEST
jgi:hypothetical protein